MAGEVAAVFHGAATEAKSIDLITDFSVRACRPLCEVLNSVRAKPRGVTSRDQFLFDASLVSAMPCLSLTHAGIPLTISRSVDRIGEFGQVRDMSEVVVLEGVSYRVLPESRRI